MKERIAFRKKVEEFLETLDQETLAYNKNEYWMIYSAYEFLEYYAFENRLWNTCIALPLARGLHDGGHRKLTVSKNGKSYPLPYVIHPMQVCRHLINLHIPIDKDVEDILLATALCHDMIEDIPFPEHGTELYTRSWERIIY